MHAESEFPVKSTWFRAIKREKVETWPCLIYSNASKYFPREIGTMKGHIVQSSQEVRSNKNKTPPPVSIKKGIFKDAPEEAEMEDIPLPIKTNELHIWDEPISKLCTGDCGRFPIRSMSDNEYIMIAYNFDSNTILQAPFSNRKKTEYEPIARS